jgi:hypothetical protein
MEKKGFTCTVYKLCDDGIARQVLAVDSQYLKSMIDAHWGDSRNPTPGAWQLPICDNHWIVFTHYTNRIRLIPWIQEKLQTALLNYQIKRALRKRAALGQSVTTISTQAVPTPEEFHAQLTSAQASLKDKQTQMPITAPERHGSPDANTTRSESSDDLVTAAYWCGSCGSMYGERHRANCARVN